MRSGEAAATPQRSRGEDRDEDRSALSIQSRDANDAEAVNADSGGVNTEERVTSLRRWILSLFRRSPGLAVASSIAVLFATAYLLAAPMGRDLSAQLAHAQLGL